MKSVRKVESIATVSSRNKRVAAYARVSSGKEAMLHSLSAQVSYYNHFIQRNPDWKFVGIYADEAQTGTKETRPQFQQLLADCRAGKIDMVVTKSISRFARNTLTILETTRELRTLGVNVFFEEQNINTMSGEGEMILTLLSSVAQEESRAISENCLWRIRDKFKRGEIVGWNQLFGYHFYKGIVEIDPENASVVRNIFAEYVNGKSACAIARDLRKEKIPSVLGGKWTSTQVTDLLQNEKYTGNQLLQKSYTVDHLSKKRKHNHGEKAMYYSGNTHPAIIDQETYQKAQDLLKSRRQTKVDHKPNDNPYPYTQKIICAKCGCHYIRKVTHGIPAWCCSTYAKYGPTECSGKRIPETTLMEETMKVLGMTSFSEEVFCRQIDHVTAAANNLLTFVFCNGQDVTLQWKNPSRRESWTQEMRGQAREKEIYRRRNN